METLRLSECVRGCKMQETYSKKTFLQKSWGRAPYLKVAAGSAASACSYWSRSPSLKLKGRRRHSSATLKERRRHR